MKSTIRAQSSTFGYELLCHELYKIVPPCAHHRQHGPPRAIVVLLLYPSSPALPPISHTELHSHWITHEIQVICLPFASLIIIPSAYPSISPISHQSPHSPPATTCLPMKLSSHTRQPHQSSCAANSCICRVVNAPCVDIAACRNFEQLADRLRSSS